MRYKNIWSVCRIYLQTDYDKIMKKQSTKENIENTVYSNKQEEVQSSHSMLTKLIAIAPYLFAIIGIAYLVHLYLTFPINNSNSINTLSSLEAPQDTASNQNIEQLLANLEQLKSAHSNHLNTAEIANTQKTNPFSDYNVTKQIYEESTEQLKARLLADVGENDRQAFQQELQQIFQVGNHQSFFERQIVLCKNKLDLAVVGMGIIRVDEVRKGANSTVLEKDRGEFIKYIKDQVQIAIASNDQNYKSIVFKGLESSSN